LQHALDRFAILVLVGFLAVAERLVRRLGFLDRLRQLLHLQRLDALWRDRDNLERGDRAVVLGVEADDREVRERLVVAQARRAEELPYKILFWCTGTRACQ